MSAGEALQKFWDTGHYVFLFVFGALAGHWFARRKPAHEHVEPPDAEPYKLSWPIVELEMKLSIQASRCSASDYVSDLKILLERVALAAEKSKLRLPPPQVEENTEGTVDIVWFDRKNHAALGFTLLRWNDPDPVFPKNPDATVWLHHLSTDLSQNLADPIDAEIGLHLRIFARRAGLGRRHEDHA